MSLQAVEVHGRLTAAWPGQTRDKGQPYASNLVRYTVQPLARRMQQSSIAMMHLHRLAVRLHCSNVDKLCCSLRASVG